MTRRLPWLALATALVMSGCYESGVPLDPSPSVAVDAALMGTWRCLPIDGSLDDQPATMVVSSPQARRYDVTWTETGGATTRYAAYGSSVKSPRLMNVQEQQQGAGEKPWEFVRYTFLLPTVMRLQIVSDGALVHPGMTATALRAIIEQHQTDADFFDDFAVCARAKAGTAK